MKKNILFLASVVFVFGAYLPSLVADGSTTAGQKLDYAIDYSKKKLEIAKEKIEEGLEIAQEKLEVGFDKVREKVKEGLDKPSENLHDDKKTKQ